MDNSKTVKVKSDRPLIIYKNIIWDTHYEDGKLYLLLVTKKDEETVKSNSLLVMDWKNKELSPSELIGLPDKGWYSRFCMLDNNGKMLAYDEINGLLEVFDLIN